MICEKKQYMLTIEAAADTIPAEVRLHHLFKLGERELGLRCLSVAESSEHPETPCHLPQASRSVVGMTSGPSTR